MKFQLGSWSFDPVTSLVTLLLAPILLYVVISLRKFVIALTRYALDGILSAASRVATQRIAAALSLRRYCQLQLSGQSRFLNVPGSIEINLNIDEIFVPLVLERAGSNEVYTHADVSNVGNRVRIIGDPGSGKSSVAKRLFRDECTRGVNTPKSARLPMLIELRRIELPKNVANNKLGEWLYQHLMSASKRHDVF